ncbi:MAG: hypothetical protein ACK4SJ_11745 [Sphingorhabdus sp.]
MSNQQQHTWADIRVMIKARMLELFDILAILGAIAGIFITVFALATGGLLAGNTIMLIAIGFAVIPNALAQALHRLYRE